MAAAERILRMRGIKGLVVFSSREPDAWDGFSWQEFSGVEVLAGSGRSSGLSRIRFDSFGNLLRAGEKVLEQRPRRAGIVLMRPESPSITDDRDYAAALLVRENWHHQGIAAPPILALDPDTGYAGILGKWVKSQHLDVVILPNSGMCWDIMQAGIRIPQELSVISLRLSGTPTAGFERNLKAFARKVIQFIDSDMRQNLKGIPDYPFSLVFPDAWVPAPP